MAPWMGPAWITSPSRSLKEPFVIGSKRYAEHSMNSTPLMPTCPPCSIDNSINAIRSLETFPLWMKRFAKWVKNELNEVRNQFLARYCALILKLLSILNLPYYHDLEDTIVEFARRSMKHLFSRVRRQMNLCHFYTSNQAKKIFFPSNFLKLVLATQDNYILHSSYFPEIPGGPECIFWSFWSQNVKSLAHTAWEWRCLTDPV